jgi:hypothetical protein
MPEFILDHGSPEGSRTFASLDAFTQGYVEAMFFTNMSDSDDGDLEYATVADLAPETFERIKRDCARFQEENADLLAQAYDREDYSEEQAGRDFWFTRNGHGVGFWDRKQLDAGDLGDALSERCGWRSKSFHELSPYLGDDGCVYLA